MEVADEFHVSSVELSALVVVQAEEGRLHCGLIDFHWFIEPRQVGVQHGTEANAASLCPSLQQPVSIIDVVRAELRGRGLARSRFNSMESTRERWSQ